MKNKLLFIVFAVLISSSFTSSDEWTLYKSQDNFEIYSRIEVINFNGISRSMLVFKYINTSDKIVTASWKLNLYYNGVCRSCDLPTPNEYEIVLKLNPKEILIGKPNSDSKVFSVFHSSPTGEFAPLDKFEFEGLKVF